MSHDEPTAPIPNDDTKRPDPSLQNPDTDWITDPVPPVTDSTLPAAPIADAATDIIFAGGDEPVLPVDDFPTVTSEVEIENPVPSTPGLELPSVVDLGGPTSAVYDSAVHLGDSIPFADPVASGILPPSAFDDGSSVKPMALSGDALDPDDAIGNLPSGINPAAPGSGWLDRSFIGSGLPSGTLPATPAETSDVFAVPSAFPADDLPEALPVGGASDVFSDLLAPPVGSSQIPGPTPMDDLDLDSPDAAPLVDESTDSLFNHLVVPPNASQLLKEFTDPAPGPSGTDLGNLPDDLFDEPQKNLGSFHTEETIESEVVEGSASDVFSQPSAAEVAEPEGEVPFADPVGGDSRIDMSDAPVSPTAPRPSTAADFALPELFEAPPGAAGDSAVFLPEEGRGSSDVIAGDMAHGSSSVPVAGARDRVGLPNEPIDDLFAPEPAAPTKPNTAATADGPNTPNEARLEFPTLPQDQGGSSLFGDTPGSSSAYPFPMGPASEVNVFGLGDSEGGSAIGRSSIFAPADSDMSRSSIFDPTGSPGGVDQIPLMQSSGTDAGNPLASAAKPAEPDTLGSPFDAPGLEDILDVPDSTGFGRPPVGKRPKVVEDPDRISFAMPPRHPDDSDQASGSVDWSAPPRTGQGFSELVKEGDVDPEIAEALESFDPLVSKPGEAETDPLAPISDSKPQPASLIKTDEDPEDDVFSAAPDTDPIGVGLPSGFMNPVPLSGFAKKPSTPDPFLGSTSDVSAAPVRHGSAWDVTVGSASAVNESSGSAIIPGAVKPNNPTAVGAGSGWMSPSIAGPASGWLSSPGVGPSSGLFAPPISQSAGSDDVQLDAHPNDDEPPTTPSGKRPSPIEPEPAPAKPPGIRGWLAGSVVGVAIGAAAGAGAFMSGMVSVADGGKPNAGLPTKPPVVAPPVDGKGLLAQGNAAAALKALEAAGEKSTPDVHAARGQARWMAHVRDRAAEGKAFDPAEFTKAEADLKIAHETAAGDDKEWGPKAALHLGLLKELAGQPEAASAIYTQAMTQFPDAKPMFESALERLKALEPAKPAPKPIQESRLDLPRIEDFKRAIVLSLIGLQAPAAETVEAGTLFWKAVNQAAGGDYDTAIATLADARKAHDKQRLANVGKGLNPTSDPLEQIFLRTCDDLTAYWLLKKEVYEHPKAGPLVKKHGVAKALTELASTAGDDKALKELMAKLEKAEKDFSDADKLAKKYETDLTDAKKAADDAKKLADDNKKLLDDKTKDFDAAADKLKAAETVVAGVVAELKANKLIPEDADPAKLGPVMKEVAATAASADAKKAAAGLLAAQKQVETAKADLKKAEAEVEAAKVAAKAAADDADKKVLAAQADADKKLAAAAAEAKKAQQELLDKLKAEDGVRAALAAQLQRDLAAEKAKFEKELARRDELFATQLAQARAGGTVPLTAGERAAKDRAAKKFGEGLTAYLDGRPSDAETAFVSATKDDANDARFWYFLGLSRLSTGNAAGAEEAFKKGADLEARNLPTSAVVSASLERIQGPARRVLATHRP